MAASAPEEPMCVVCQNVPAVMTALSGAGLMTRSVVRRVQAGRTDADEPAGQPPTPISAAPVQCTPPRVLTPTTRA